MKTRFIGDVHGYVYELRIILDDIPADVTSVVQVGDMGVGFGQGDYWLESLEDLLQSANARFIRGNHDNLSTCKTMSTWIPDGRVENDVMFVGGAWSIDNPNAPPGWQKRIENYNWWRDEELSYPELYNIHNTYVVARPRVMVTHDIPQSVSSELFFAEGRILHGKDQYDTRTGLALDDMFSMHKPKLHIFGHWHHNIDEVVDGTRFICLDELSYIDVDMETLEVTYPDFMPKRGKP
jgi:predicted phosphodiesterase